MSGSNGKRPTLVADKRYASARKPAAKKPAARKAKPKRRRARTAPRRGLVARFFFWLVGGIFGWILRTLWRVGWRVGALGAIVLALAVGYFALTMPPASTLLDARARGSVTLLDRNGEVFAWRGEQFGGQITTDTVAPELKNAIIATEDKRFYRHFGISPRGVASAIRINLREGRGPLQGHGGSTITQQVAKLLCIGAPFDPDGAMTEAEYEADCRRSTVTRKAKEAIYAMALELRYSKDEILTIYLNRAYLGAGSRGFEAAAQRYFGKSAAEVSAAEGAMLAGLLVAPSRFAPTANLERSQNRANLIIGLMEDQGYLTTSAARAARDNPAVLSVAAEARAGGYFADWVMDLGPAFLTRETTEDVIVRTTFDQDIQTAAEVALQEVFDTQVRAGSEAQAAIVVMSADGAVRAMVGGRKFRGVSGQFNRAIQAKRQTGSAFKPFIYAAALDLGYTPNNLVRDEPLTIDVPGSGPWSPQNYDRQFRGPVTLTSALKHSLNIPAVRVSETVGRENVRTVAENFGVRSDLADGPALALGVSESTLLEMTGAYAGILNGGSSVMPYGLLDLRIKGDDVPIIGQEGGMGERVITQAAAQQLVYMMSEVINSGTGQRARLPGRPAAGKTGTTQAARDAWFLGFTADYVAGVWMGYDDNTPLTGVTGGGLPAAIWRETMVGVHEGLPARALPMLVPQPSASELQAERRRQRTQGSNPIEQIILDVLDAIGN
ncbi:MAG: PBP1A family penicillin-binding protein [Rhodobacteraceae bacterium]|nr:PBP1A family penicillin-binding protein [Paracoccaceae bacterium]